MAVPLPFPTTPYPRLDRPHDYNHIPRRQSEMKVLALGMPRTGTMSLYTALNELGYNCYHMAEAALDHRNLSLKHWQEAIVARYYELGEEYKGEDFDKMLWRYDAVTDIPSILFAEELMDAYPDAQIILTTRDVDEWLPSMERAFYKVLNMKRWRLLELFDYTYMRPYMHLLRTTLNIWTGRHWKDKDQLTATYIAHNALVRGQAQRRGRKVLEFHVRDGWGPLCEFLGKPIPAKPFPWVNRGDFIAQYHYIGFWIRVFYVLLGFGVWGVVDGYFENFYGVNSVL
ncbi:P-loop containing nucleoside triphosphate hydrolase protein [Aspergillus pseudodeflectus]|uniref:P-loop containing nucleoside triphosphate hydrolase protein n=1 Tax=Aspergillus pseudodeflectus TaxID=176178 RepID=A0ABR4L342_9EURO